MAKWHGYGRCKTRLSKDIGKLNSLAIQIKMTQHTLSVAKSLEEKDQLLGKINNAEKYAVNIFSCVNNFTQFAAISAVV